VPFSTRKPRIVSPSFAHTTATSEIEPFVIQRFVPESTQAPPSGRARVSMAPGSEPWSGSVSPKQPIARPAAISGSQRRFCSSLPQRQMAYMASEPCTDAIERSPESPASSSCMMRP
jgi:hypothetical protein